MKKTRQDTPAKFGQWVTDRKPSFSELVFVPGEEDLYPYYQGVFLVWALGEPLPRFSRFVMLPKDNKPNEWYTGYFTSVSPGQKVAWMPPPHNPHETK
jgi:hypothetical protein